MFRRPRARRTALLAALFLVHALPFLSRPALIGGDEPHYALMAHSLAVDGDLDLEEDYRRVEAGSPAAGRKIAGWRLDRHVRVATCRARTPRPRTAPPQSACGER